MDPLRPPALPQHHKKYQHIHQKSFSCPEPACGKSFNFKKHLKEHVKLHSGECWEWPLTSLWLLSPTVGLTISDRKSVV